MVAAWVLNAIGTMPISYCQNMKRSAPTLLKIPCLFHMCSVLVCWSVYWVRRKGRLKPARFFIGCGKAERFWIDYTPIYRQQPRRRIELLDRPSAVSNAIGYAEHCSRSHHAVIRVYDDAGNVIETHEHKASSKSGSAIPGHHSE
jgi:hypothetical protein